MEETNKTKTEEAQNLPGAENTGAEVTPVLPEDPRDDDMGLRFFDKDFLYETMSVPTHTKQEFRLVEYVVFWCLRNHVKYEFDEYGNIYLTKGTLDAGEYYPCVTSHLDSVQTKQGEYAKFSLNMKIKTERVKEGHKISIDGGGIGIGADDKGGVCICLAMFSHVDKLKACFFLEEESGCCGSNHMDKEWFNDVGYVIGYDSPDLFRAAWACSGVKLFSYAFYEKYMKPVCDKWGLKKGCFFSEPYTDVKVIRTDTHIICMNFGNGGYNAHMQSEYCIVEHMDHALGMGIELVGFIGNTRHMLDDTSANTTGPISIHRQSNGLFSKHETGDTKLLEALGTSRSYGSNSGTNTTTYRTISTKEEELDFESVEYITNRYEDYIKYLEKTVTREVTSLCADNQVDPAKFTEAIKKVFSKEITF